ncbi:hypothetical protein C7E17_24310 [Stenotrophomonas maltophilia]|nr:hypothetical protein C7E17_24310 [Stenotrophomonas maltophilia]
MALVAVMRKMLVILNARKRDAEVALGCPDKTVATADRRDLSKAGWVRLRGREPHGCGDRAYMDVLAAAPATGPPA